MSYREELHTRICQGNALKAALENLIELGPHYTDHQFRLDIQDNVLMQMADTYLDPNEMGFADSTCICAVRGSMVFDLGLTEFVNDTNVEGDGYWQYRKTGLTDDQVRRLEERIAQFLADDIGAEEVELKDTDESVQAWDEMSGRYDDHDIVEAGAAHYLDDPTHNY